LTFPDLNDLYRAERNRRIRIEFIGNNYEELAIKYGVGVRTVRKVLLG
jgi:Mor family transcriptional regulator